MNHRKVESFDQIIMMNNKSVVYGNLRSIKERLQSKISLGIPFVKKAQKMKAVRNCLRGFKACSHQSSMNIFLSRQQGNNYFMMLKENPTKFAVNNVDISNNNQRFIHSNFVLLKERMFDNDLEQQIYEREKEALMRGRISESGENETDAQEPENGMTNFVVVSSLFLCVWYGIKYLYNQYKTSIRENENFDWLMSGSLNTNTLSEADETNIASLLSDIKTLVKEHQYIDEFYSSVSNR